MDRTFLSLTNAQKSIWVSDHLYPGSSQNNLAETVVIPETIDFALMNQAFNKVIKNNDALRTRLIIQNGIPKQYFAQYSFKEFEVIDFACPGGETEFKNWQDQVIRKPFQLRDSELFHWSMLKLSGEKSICFFKFHHIIIDGWGVVLVTNKIIKEYWQMKNAIYSDNDDEPSYLEHIVNEQNYMASERFDKQKAFWREVFATVPDLISLNQNKNIICQEARRKTFVLPKGLSLKLQTFCQEYHLSIFNVFYVLLAIYFSKVSSKKDIVIGTPVLNRTGIREKSTVGLFMHNMPTRVFIEPNLDFISFATMTSKNLKKYFKNQRYPYSLILKDFREEHQFSEFLVDISLNYHNTLYEPLIPFQATWNYSGAQTNSLSLSISDRDATGTPRLDYDYLLEIFNDEAIDQLHRSLCNLLEDSLDHPFKKLKDLQIMSEAEQTQIIYGFNQTKLAYQPLSLPEMFEKQVEKSPDNPAILFAEQRLSYRELNEKSNQLARHILGKNIASQALIGLCISRSPEMIIGILGILKAGCAYLPIDPSYPKERISYMLSQSGAGLILTDTKTKAIIAANTYEAVDISLRENQIYDADHANLEQAVSPDDLAYVIYTSGSSGKPKGVMVHQKALSNFINGITAIFKFSGKTILSLTTVSFDIFFLETILPLTLGMKVVIANEEEQTIPRLLLNLIERHKVDVLQVTPSRMKLILSEKYGRECLKNLAYLLVGGETFPASLLSNLRQATQAKIYNMYGPTETTIWSSVKELSAPEAITIGRPIANTQIYILDENLIPVPVEALGEIYISGDGVSKGYLNNPELSQKSFIPDPFAKGRQMYRTGDSGRWLRNGEVEYLGRKDNQVKIRGFRIELGEIEVCLSRHPEVKEAVVVTRRDKRGKEHLSAYFTGEKKLAAEELKAFILQYLPNYMVPGSFTWLACFPQTPNGKLDRRGLPDPGEFLDINNVQDYEAPRNDLEAKMAVLWAQALEVMRVGIDDNLFSLGGDSLTILEIMSGALGYSWKLDVQDFYECPTIRELSLRISGIKQTQLKISKHIPQPKGKTMTVSDRRLIDVGNLLLTGATGFLGIHLLSELLLGTNQAIYCIVRGQDPQSRLAETFNYYYGSFPDEYKRRVKVISGDITLKHLGLADEVYQELGCQVQTVIHCAGLTKHYGNYDSFEQVNVDSTNELIDFCLNFDKRLNHISTLSIVGNYSVDKTQPNRVFREEDFYIGQDYTSNVYIRSKFAAENQILNAEANGLRANVFRVGILTGRYADGKFQINIEKNAFYRKIKALLLLKTASESFLEQNIELTPVDLCARGIVDIIRRNPNNGLTFHMFNHRKLPAKDLLRFLKKLNFPIEVLTNEKYYSLILELSKTKSGQEILSGMITDLVTDKGLAFDTLSKALTIDSSFTINYLAEMGFTWPDIDQSYIAKMIKHMLDVGFIKDNKNGAKAM